jgi:hypothetical protein
MERAYEIPTKDNSTKVERNNFWERVIIDQQGSGISAKKFCQKYQIPFAMYKNRLYRYRGKSLVNGLSATPPVKAKPATKSPTDVADKLPNQSKFIQVQLDKNAECALSLRQDIYSPGEQSISVKITFKNCNVMEIVLPNQECLLETVEQVSKLS